MKGTAMDRLTGVSSCMVAIILGIASQAGAHRALGALTPPLGCTDPPDTSGIRTNFEDATAQGWTPRIGEETLTASNADAHGGNFSLLTTGRQHTYSGPTIDAAGKMCNGSQYNVSVWAK